MLFNFDEVGLILNIQFRMVENLQIRKESEIEHIENEYENIQDRYTEQHLSLNLNLI